MSQPPLPEPRDSLYLFFEQFNEDGTPIDTQAYEDGVTDLGDGNVWYSGYPNAE